jgi:hypothetical protein
LYLAQACAGTLRLQDAYTQRKSVEEFTAIARRITYSTIAAIPVNGDYGSM